MDVRAHRAAVILLLLVGVVAWPPASASAYTVRRAPDGRAVRWRAPRVELRVDPTLAHDPESARAAVLVAADAWRSAPLAPTLAVGGPTAGVPGYHGPRGENGIYSIRGAWDYGPALAVTVTTAVEQTGEILDADVLVAARGDVGVAARDGAAPRSFDLAALLAHELGHVLGLGESDVVGATMYPSLARGDLGPRTIETDDEEGVLAAYEAAGAAVRGCAASPGRPGTFGGLGVLAALALGTVLGARRRAARVLALALGASIAALLAGFDPPAESRAPEADAAVARALFAGSADRARVEAVEVVVRDGLFVTRCDVLGATGARTIEVPGGARDGLVQIAGEALPPAPGDELVLGAGDAWAYADAAHAWGGWLETSAPLPLSELAPRGER